MLQKTPYSELAELRDRVAYLEEELARRDRETEDEVGAVMRATGLPVGLSRLLMALSSGVSLTRDRLAVLCHHAEDADMRLVDSQIKRLRKQLPSSIKVQNLYGIGYYIPPEYLKAAREFMKGKAL